MPRLAQKSPRRQQILESIALMLEQEPDQRITTAALAETVGVSEAALYRHFPSKAKMFEGLIDYVEDVIFSRIKIILTEEQQVAVRLERMFALLLGFAEKNPGLSCIINGDALAGENERVRSRVAQFYDRLDVQVKQVLREGELQNGIRPRLTTAAASNLLLATVEGRICQFVRSKYSRKPTQFWPEQWQQLMQGYFRENVAEKPKHSISRAQTPLIAGGQSAG